ncbi:hypothetical protein [Bradyrhizobium sp. NAS96.2]|uniref:hypothetical protein n=1 Tax=Bradyrhizobium sp. NAS96.2 TaxID=1680160 RepID=UPI00093C7E5D|nr:hypothetical protein [Bradyrhizobium sp. NAS96.2]
MSALRGAAFKIEGPPENGSAAPTANRDGTDHRRNEKPLGSASTLDRYEPRSASSTGKETGPTKKRRKQTVDDRFAGETPKQIALHREIDHHYAGRFAWDDRDDPGRPKPTAKQNVRMRDLEAFLEHRYRGRRLPDDDSGREDLRIAAHHCYYYGDPDRKIRAWVCQWAPWLSESERAELIERVCKRPLKWKADTLGRKLRATRKEIEMLGITTFGAFDDSTRKRAKRREKRKADRRRARRHAAGATPQVASTERAEPWKAAGISRRTWYRRRKAETAPPVSEALSVAYSVTVNLSIDGSVAQNGTTFTPTRYLRYCWVSPAKAQVFRPAAGAAEYGRATGGAGIGTVRDRLLRDGRVALSAPPAAKKTVKKVGGRSCFHRENGEQQ